MAPSSQGSEPPANPARFIWKLSWSIPKRRSGASPGVTAEQIARLERELAGLQTQVRTVEETYGVDNLHLTVAKGYLRKLLGMRGSYGGWHSIAMNS